MQGGVDPDKFLIEHSMKILLRILKEDELASKCKASAHMILVAIKRSDLHLFFIFFF